jgi:hypothetical protein
MTKLEELKASHNAASAATCDAADAVAEAVAACKAAGAIEAAAWAAYREELKKTHKENSDDC